MQRTMELDEQVNEDDTYINEELGNIETTVRENAEKFTACSDNVNGIFDASFEKLKTAIKACMAV
jgi:hypothetical protein